MEIRGAGNLFIGIKFIGFKMLHIPGISPERFRLTFRYQWASVVYLLALNILGALVSVFPGWFHANTPGIHFVQLILPLFGWVSMVIIGTEYTLVPFMLLTDLQLKKWAEVGFWLLNIGLVGMVFGFALDLKPFATLSSALYIMATFIHTSVVLQTIRKRGAMDVTVRLTVRYIATAIPYFLLALLLLTLDYASYARVLPKFLPIALPMPVFIHLTTLGWISFTIMGALYIMIPMISGAEMY